MLFISVAVVVVGIILVLLNHRKDKSSDPDSKSKLVLRIVIITVVAASLNGIVPVINYLNPKTPAATEKGMKTNSIGMKFAHIPSGTFMMGSPASESGRDGDEKQHRVTLAKAYYMQTTEVTQGQWKAVMGSNPSHFKNCGDDCPVESISWNDVQDFIRKLNQQEGKNRYRLPTEAEWEYSGRSGSTTAFANGGIGKTDCSYDPNLDAIGWYCGNSEQKTHPVAQKQANRWGLYDMHGNVWEWCRDWYDKEYYKKCEAGGAIEDPVGPEEGSIRVLRGGGWSYYGQFCRSADRTFGSPAFSGSFIGFRLVSVP